MRAKVRSRAQRVPGLRLLKVIALLFQKVTLNHKDGLTAIKVSNGASRLQHVRIPSRIKVKSGFHRCRV